MCFLGATGRIRTSGLPGRRTTTWRYRPTLKREFCWFCTFTAKTRKSPLVVVTTGFSGILWSCCTVVVKWWSKISATQYAAFLLSSFSAPLKSGGVWGIIPSCIYPDIPPRHPDTPYRPCYRFAARAPNAPLQNIGNTHRFLPARQPAVWRQQTAASYRARHTIATLGIYRYP